MNSIPANGAHIPVLGLGTFRLRGEECARVVAEAAELGYRHFDTAAMYDNEEDVGEGLVRCGVKRSEIFVTTKVWHSDIGGGALQRSAEASLKRLKLGFADLLLIHWPNASIPLGESIEALCDAKARGFAKNIGVANFPMALLREAVGLAAQHGEKIACNQCERHPRFPQAPLLDVCRENGVGFVSYQPIAQGNYLDDPVLVKIARSHGRETSQIVLRWQVQQPGVAAIPKASSRKHLAENLALFDFQLTAEEMSAINAMARAGSRKVNPGFAPAWDY